MSTAISVHSPGLCFQKMRDVTAPSNCHWQCQESYRRPTKVTQQLRNSMFNPTDFGHTSFDITSCLMMLCNNQHRKIRMIKGQTVRLKTNHAVLDMEFWQHV